MEKRLNDLLKKMVAEGQIPQYVYKMRNINRYLFDMLINGEMWVSSPKDFNDPFDCDINISTKDSTQTDIQTYYDKYLSKMCEKHEIEKIKNLNITIAEFEKLINFVSKKVLHKKGVACFLDNKDNLLMWSHYADSHRGVCMKFDILEAEDFFSPAKKVIYKQAYPVYNYLSDKNKVADLLFTKSEDWKYEGEVRVVKEKPGNYPFAKTALKEIVFGCKVSEGDKKTISSIIKDKYPATKIFQAQKNNNKFELEFIEQK
jgi:hypothetical protein